MPLCRVLSFRQAVILIAKEKDKSNKKSLCGERSRERRDQRISGDFPASRFSEEFKNLQAFRVSREILEVVANNRAKLRYINY